MRPPRRRRPATGPMRRRPSRPPRPGGGAGRRGPPATFIPSCCPWAARRRRPSAGPRTPRRVREQPEVELEHLAAALLEAPETSDVIRRLGVDPASLRPPLDQAMDGFARVPGEEVYLGAAVLRLLDIAQIDARERGSDKVEP